MKKTNLLSLIAVMTVYMVATSQGVIASVLNSMYKVFPDVARTTVRLASTGHSLTAIITALFIGNIVGKKMSYRTCLILGSIFLLVGGAGPYFVKDSLYAIIGMRMIFGFGVSFVAQRATLLRLTFDKNKAASYIGYGTAIGQGVAMLMSILCGILIDIAWYNGFLVYLVAIIPVVCTILFLKNPEKTEELKTESGEISKDNSKIPLAAFIFAILMFFVAVASSSTLISVSTLVVEKGLGKAALAGTFISVFSIGGFFNVLFGKLYAKLKKWSVTVMIIFMAVGHYLAYAATSVTMLFTGGLLEGIGFLMFMSACYFFAVKDSSPSKSGVSASLIIFAASLANFASGYFIALGNKIIPSTGSTVGGGMILGVIVFVIIGLLTISNKVIPNE